MWADYGVSVEEDVEVGEIMNLVGLADDIWSEVVLSDEEKSWRKGGDAVNVCDSGGAVGELWKIIWCFRLKGVAMADSDWDEDDRESGWAERRFELVKKDGGGDLINDGCNKYDDDGDDCGANTSCNVLEISCVRCQLGEGDLYNTVPCLENCLAKSRLGLGAWKSLFNFLQ